MVEYLQLLKIVINHHGHRPPAETWASDTWNISKINQRFCISQSHVLMARFLLIVNCNLILKLVAKQSVMFICHLVHIITINMHSLSYNLQTILSYVSLKNSFISLKNKTKNLLGTKKVEAVYRAMKVSGKKSSSPKESQATGSLVSIGPWFEPRLR